MFQLCFLYLILSTQRLVSTNDEFVCPKDGQWPHPSDCEKYYRCNSGISVEGWCGSGMSYDPEPRRCDLSKNVECQNGERPSWKPPEGWGESDKTPAYVVTKTTTLSHNDRADDYEAGDDFDGNNHVEVKKTTRASKHRRTTTVTKRTVAATKAARNRVTLSMLELNENNDCTFQGDMPSPDNCQFYYTCRDDVLKRIRCPDKQLFDEDTRMCSDFRKVFCGDRPINERETDPCLGQPNGWYADHESQCRSYYQCADQRKSKMNDCPIGTKWNSLKLRCDDPKNIIAPCGTRSSNGISLLPQQQSWIVINTLFLLFVLTSL